MVIIDVKRFSKVIDYSPVWIPFFLGFWFVILKPLGPHLALVPGDLGDARFNNYVLEHFFRWVTGLTPKYWDAPFFFPFQQTIFFSDNLLGSAPFYVLFRWVGFDRATAFQGWYMLGYLLNYASASYVLRRLKLKPLAVGTGAFFFSFGLPMLAQENHVQLLYRFCVPLACFTLWQFYHMPRLWKLVTLSGWIVWQFYLTIYIGVFLLFLLTVLAVLLPFFFPAKTFWQQLALWPKCVIESWTRARTAERILAVAGVSFFGLCFVFLTLSYFRASRNYGFSRQWEEISTMLPYWRSYLLADNSQLWDSVSGMFIGLPIRHEHQLFPGLAILALVLVGIVGRFYTENSRLAWLHFCAAVILIVLTLQIHGSSLFQLIWRIPGLNSIRAVTRIILVLMWPLSLFIAWAIDGFLQWFSRRHRWMQIVAYLFAGLLVVESVFYTHTTYEKGEAQARLDNLRQQLPTSVPSEPVLFVAENQPEPSWGRAIDAMLLSQDLGWPTLNGYSGNAPPGYASLDSCNQLPARIKNYMDFVRISNPSFYFGLMERVVSIGFEDCDPNWWKQMPSSLGSTKLALLAESKFCWDCSIEIIHAP